MTTSWDEEFDVVVCGSGAAGCAAAIAASLNGAGRVLICEKDGMITGGTTRMSMGGWVWFPRNRFLREHGVAEPVEMGKEKELALSAPNPGSPASAITPSTTASKL